MATSTSTWLSSMALGVALSATSAATAQATNHALGVCQVTTEGANWSGAQISPIYAADAYMTKYISKSNPYFKKFIADGYSFREAATKILAEPKHGELNFDSTNNSSISPAKEGWYVYVAKKGYSGEDNFIIQVSKYGLKINIHYTVVVVDYTSDNGDGYCEPELWKISQVDVAGADGTALASTTFSPENAFQPDSPSQPGLPLPQFPLDLSLLALTTRRKSGASSGTTTNALTLAC